MGSPRIIVCEATGETPPRSIQVDKVKAHIILIIFTYSEVVRGVSCDENLMGGA